MPVDGSRRLSDGDVLGVLPGVAYRVELAPAPVVRRSAPIAVPAPVPVHALSEPSVGFRLRARRVWRRWRDRARRRGPRGGTRWLGWALGVTATLLVIGAGVLVWRAVFPSEAGLPAALTEADARAYDAVAAQAEDHIERGSTLLEIGLPDPALREFGAAVTTLESTPLRTNPWVRPRIDALEAGIASIYRERRVAVPTRFARAAPTRSASGASAPLAREARLSTAEFSAHLEQVRSAFSARFGHELVVTGRDHAEHLALYGPGGRRTCAFATCHRTRCSSSFHSSGRPGCGSRISPPMRCSRHRSRQPARPDSGTARARGCICTPTGSSTGSIGGPCGSASGPSTATQQRRRRRDVLPDL